MQFSSMIVTPALPRLRRYKPFSGPLEHFPRFLRKRYQMPELRIPLECLGASLHQKKEAPLRCFFFFGGGDENRTRVRK